MKYLSQAYFSLTIPAGVESRRRDGEQNSMVLDYLKSHAERNDEPSLFSIVDMRTSLRLSVAKIINSMLYYQEQSVLSLNESMRCEIMTRRYWEVKYMVDRNKNDFTLHIIFNGLRSLLGPCRIGEERIIDMKERTEICNHLLDDFSCETTTETKKRRGGHVEKTTYMPWKSISDKDPKGAVLIAETFKKDIKGRTGNNMFRILRHIPGVEFKVKQTNEEITYRIKVKDEYGRVLWVDSNYEGNFIRTGVKYVMENVTDSEGKPIIDSEGNPITTPDVEGEMCYRGRNVTMGYARSREDLLLGDERNGKVQGVHET